MSLKNVGLSLKRWIGCFPLFSWILCDSTDARYEVRDASLINTRIPYLGSRIRMQSIASKNNQINRTMNAKWERTRNLVVAVTCLLIMFEHVQAENYNFGDDPIAGIGDGKSDNREAIVRAFKSLISGDTLFVPAGDYRVVLTKGQLKIPAGVTLVGERGKSRFLLECSDGESKHREFLRFAEGVTLEGLTVIRNADFPAVLFPVFGEFSNVTIRNCLVDGNKERFPEKYCHAIQVGEGNVQNFVIERTEIRNCSFGLFQANKSTGTLKDMLVKNCMFEHNTASDLEYNSPRGKMSDIVVCDCVFKNNRSKSAGAGFAVGFANVKNSRVENCTIRNYGSEALHVEDHSENIVLKGNTIVGCSNVRGNGVIMVLSESKGISIDSNYVDARSNTNKVHLVLVTAGGGKFGCPGEVTVKDNVLINGPKTRTWYLQPGSGPEAVGNVVVDWKE